MEGTVGRALAWAGIISCVFWGFWARTGHAWVPFVVIGGLCVAYLISAARRDRRRSTTLPSPIERLAFYSDDRTVVFAWKWRRGHEGRVRLLRSDTRAAQSPDTAAGQTCVFDGTDDKAIDDGVLPRRSYHYSLFVSDEDGRWSEPVCQPVLTYPQAERAAIEATLKGPPVTSRYADPDHSRHYSGLDSVGFGAAQSIGDSLGGAATDLIFSVASVFAADKTASGWEEIT
jgi:hypothetical protein